MSTLKHGPLRAYCRVIIELTGPCCVGTGSESFQSDMPFLTDHNGLPTLPGSTLAGLLRAALRQVEGDDVASHWFGHTQGEQAHASRVRISWASIHDEQDQPVDCLMLPTQRSAFLQALSLGEVRDRVRLNEFGAVDAAGKFDQQLVYRGCRFSFDMEIVAQPDERPALERIQATLLSLLHDSSTRLGKGIHSGFGRFEVVRVMGKCFDLRDSTDFEQYRRLPVALDGAVDLPSLSVHSIESKDQLIELTLLAESFFAVSGGDPVLADVLGDEKPDRAPMRTRQVQWQNGRGRLSKHHVLLPATAIKGALAHRVAFHANRLGNRFIEDDERPPVGEENSAVRELFGFAKDDDDARMGCVVFEDVVLDDAQTHIMTHTSIDAFTAGVRKRRLFSEEVIAHRHHNGQAQHIHLVMRIEQPEQLDQVTREAFDAAIADLCGGRLTLGGGWSKGYGRMKGEVK